MLLGACPVVLVAVLTYLLFFYIRVRGEGVVLLEVRMHLFLESWAGLCCGGEGEVEGRYVLALTFQLGRGEEGAPALAVPQAEGIIADVSR